MKQSKDRTATMADWIDHQFAYNQLFPCNCSALVDGQPCVCSAHLRAYEAWNTTPREISDINDWVDEWLNDDEKKALMASLEDPPGEYPSGSA